MIEIYTDAATRNNPGPSGIGVFIKSSKEQHNLSEYIGHYSNHEAEFIAVIKALEFCQERYPNEILSFRSDSKVVVETIEKRYTKNQAFQILLNKVNHLSAAFPYIFIKWIPEKQNGTADQLAKAAIKNQ
ncbi:MULTISPECIES: reverse transcriptase-like protein [Gracilibacillus]|uniref:reverse transcriptase-like protein n=1 Tax=Gracilibacillus TaxID=74385 RepID=UPI0006D0BD05